MVFAAILPDDELELGYVHRQSEKVRMARACEYDGEPSGSVSAFRRVQDDAANDWKGIKRIEYMFRKRRKRFVDAKNVTLPAAATPRTPTLAVRSIQRPKMQPTALQLWCGILP